MLALSITFAVVWLALDLLWRFVLCRPRGQRPDHGD